MNPEIVYEWRRYFEDIGLRDDLIQAYIPFVERCVSRKIPPIFETDHLSLLVGREPIHLMAMIYGTRSYYRSFKIRKRSGGTRTIEAPYPSLLEVQQWVSENILKKQRLPNCVTGFREGYSIIDNARMHCGRDQILKIDLKDFFPSITLSRVMKVFLGLGYPLNVALSLGKLCTLDGHLPQGAATSPVLSNIICMDMDQRFLKLCRNQRLRYTRYADDITISGKKIPKGIRRLCFEIIHSEGFFVNDKKVRFLKQGDRKVVTGLDITSGTPRVTRRFRRDIQKDVYFVWSAGLTSHVSRRRIFFPNYIDHLEGRVNFWASVEPNNRQMLRTLERVRSVRSVYGGPH